MTIRELFDWAADEGVLDAEIEVINGHEDIVTMENPEIVTYGDGEIAVELFE